MRTAKQLRTVITAWLLLMLWATCSAEVVDRSIAIVNGHLVTWSDLDEQMRFEALENGRALKDLTAAERHTAFDHLVQNWVLRDQMLGIAPATEAEIAAQLAQLRAGLRLQDEAKWKATLDSYGIAEDEFRKLLANQLEILKFLDFRARPLVSVSRQEVEEYYNQKLVPQVEAQGQKAEPVEKLSRQIRELLREQKVNQEMEKTVQSLRAQAQVQILWDGVREAPGTGQSETSVP